MYRWDMTSWGEVFLRHFVASWLGIKGRAGSRSDSHDLRRGLKSAAATRLNPEFPTTCIAKIKRDDPELASLHPHFPCFFGLPRLGGSRQPSFFFIRINH